MFLLLLLRRELEAELPLRVNTSEPTEIPQYALSNII
jgi:hypothetical protein